MLVLEGVEQYIVIGHLKAFLYFTISKVALILERTNGFIYMVPRKKTIDN